jgi:beta-lactamase regulating signal transducer with metallopeptidase domain
VAALLQIGLVNAAIATVLALVVALIGKKVRRPALLHALWIVVLANLVMPPLFEVAIEFPLLVSRAPERTTEPAHSPAQPHDTRAAMDLMAGDPNGERLVSNGGAPIAKVDSPPRAAVRGTDKTEAATPGPVMAFASRMAAAISTAFSVWTAWARGHLIELAIWVWLGGAALWFLRQGLTALRFSRRLALAIPAPSAVQQQADDLARAMGLAYHPPVLIVRDVISPMLWGIGRNARLLFPMDLLNRLDDSGRETLIAHELAHFRRGDHWVRAFELAVSGLYWWHPVVWWARREMEIAEEECCDAWVIEQFPASPRCYAEALLETIDFLSAERLVLPPAAAGLGHVPFLRRRLTAIMRGVAPKAMSRPGWLAFAVVFFGSLPWHPALTPAVARANVSPRSLTIAELLAENGGLVDSEGARTAAELREIAQSLASIGGETSDVPPAVVEELPWAVAKSPGGRYVISRRGKENNVHLEDMVTGKRIDLSEYRIVTVAFSADGTTFATAGADNAVRWWASSTAEMLRPPFRGHAKSVQSVAFAHNDKVLVSADLDGTLKLWNLELASELSTVRTRSLPVNCLTVLPDGHWMAVGTGDWKKPEEGGHVVVWDLNTLEELHVFDCDQAIGVVAFKSDGKTLAAGDFHGRVTFFDLETLTRLGTTRPRFKDAIAAAQFSPDTEGLSRVGLDDIERDPPVFENTLPSLFGTIFDQSASLDPFAGHLFNRDLEAIPGSRRQPTSSGMSGGERVANRPFSDMRAPLRTPAKKN